MDRGVAKEEVGHRIHTLVLSGTDLSTLEPSDINPMPERPLRVPAPLPMRAAQDAFISKVMTLLLQGREIGFIEEKYMPSPEVVRLVKDVRMTIYPDGWNGQKIEGSEKMPSGKTVCDFVRTVVKN